MTLADLPTLTVPKTDRLSGLPVAIIGAGPIGLAAAAQLLERGIEVVVLEAGATAGSAVQSWGHTRLFSPWEYLIDDAAARLLDKTDWDSPAAKRLPYGRDLVDSYLEPLAATAELAPRIRYNATVTAVSRQGMDRTRSTGRASAPFVVRIRDENGAFDTVLARAVIDASGTYANANGVLASGLQPTSDAVAAHILPALPDVLGRDRDQFAGKATIVVGAGHSAANTLIKLAQLADEVPGTTVTWVIRGVSPVRVYGSSDDELEARGALGDTVHNLVRAGKIVLVDRFEIDDVETTNDGRVRAVGRRRHDAFSVEADAIVNATGFRPNLDMLRELRLSLDEIVEAPAKLAPLIDPNMHSCGTVYPHGVDELTHPEPNFFVAGMKSYGRAPTFLLLTGYEQVRSIADELAGNAAAARQVQLVLPSTGVCSTAEPAADDTVTSCDSATTAPAASGSCCG